jgi:hypothetical protein
LANEGEVRLLIPQLFCLFIGIALISMGSLGYQLGLKQQEIYVLPTVLTVVWTVVIVIILDLSAPRWCPDRR